MGFSLLFRRLKVIDNIKQKRTNKVYCFLLDVLMQIKSVIPPVHIRQECPVLKEISCRRCHFKSHSQRLCSNINFNAILISFVCLWLLNSDGLSPTLIKLLKQIPSLLGGLSLMLRYVMVIISRPNILHNQSYIVQY